MKTELNTIKKTIDTMESNIEPMRKEATESFDRYVQINKDISDTQDAIDSLYIAYDALKRAVKKGMKL